MSISKSDIKDIMSPPNGITSISNVQCSNSNMPLVPGISSSVDQPGEYDQAGDFDQAGDGEMHGLAVNIKTKVQPKNIEMLYTGYV